MIPISGQKIIHVQKLLDISSSAETRRDKAPKERCIAAYKQEKRKVKRCIFPSKNEQFGRKINQIVGGNRKIFWKDESKANGGKVESCIRIRNRNGRR